MNDKTHWEIARSAKLPGVITTQHVDPARISTRTKRATQRMIVSGLPAGGWASKARQLAVLISDQHGLGMCRYSGNHLRFGATDDVKLRDEVVKLFEADFAAYKLEHGPVHVAWSNRIRDGVHLLNQGLSADLYFHDPMMARNAAVLIADSVTDALKERRKEVAALLDGFELIPITPE